MVTDFLFAALALLDTLGAISYLFSIALTRTGNTLLLSAMQKEAVLLQQLIPN